MLRNDVEKLKIALSTRTKGDLFLPDERPVSVNPPELEDILKKPVLDKCRGPIRVALKLSLLDASKLDHVLFVGGPTFMPCVRATVADELRNLAPEKNF